MYEWVIVGGGIHGVTVATFLIRTAGVSREQILIVDPNDQFLADWERRAKAVGMDTLRSSLVHHLDTDPFSLRSFSESREGRVHGELRGQYGHPDTELFGAHCRKVIEENELYASHLRAKVLAIQPEASTCRLRVCLSEGTVCGRNVVLALGNPEPLYPQWAEELSSQGKSILHAFDLVQSAVQFKGNRVAVIGGGLTAAQVALKIQSCGAPRVKIFSRHTLRKFQFDSDPGWIGPKYRSSFEKTICPALKRKKITEARRRGSITPEVLRTLRRAIRKGVIELAVGDGSLHSVGDSADHRQQEANDCFAEFDSVVLATGFEQNVPGGDLVTDIARGFRLPLSPCGIPLLSESVHWGKGIFASGALAEMRIGPIARNISGARSAASEIVQLSTQ